MGASKQDNPERARLSFANAVTRSLAFLGGLGFEKVEALPTIVRYQKGELEVAVYHGRQSFEIGFEVTRLGTRYSISELIGATDAEAAERYHSYAATTPQGIAEGLARLEALVRLYALQALNGDDAFFTTLENNRKTWAKEYALDVLAGQLRPKAEAAFRNREYRLAAELYERIRPRLGAVELKKLILAKERAGL